MTEGSLENAPILSEQPRAPLVPFNVPAVEEWKELWKTWDLITMDMIPPSMLYDKPIDLRHKCLFYLGHIPACVTAVQYYLHSNSVGTRFLDIHLSKLLKEPNTEPDNYKYIFEVSPPNSLQYISWLLSGI
jgi:L-histidine Nalpha-methyltransferase / hercynylcysteine S-oxide synthase